jgi:hypothetical protein
MFKDERRTLCGYWRKSVAASDSRHLDSFKQRASGSSRTMESGCRSACAERPRGGHSERARRLQEYSCTSATTPRTPPQSDKLTLRIRASCSWARRRVESRWRFGAVRRRSAGYVHNLQPFQEFTFQEPLLVVCGVRTVGFDVPAALVLSVLAAGFFRPHFLKVQSSRYTV